MYKLVGFDLDGTLLNDNREITLKTYNDLYKLLSSNTKPIITTGRGYNSANKFFKKENIEIDIISNNGNIIRNSKTDKILFINEIEKKTSLEILNNCKNKNIYPLVHINAYEEGYDIATVKKDCSSHVKTYPEGFGKRTMYLNNFDDIKNSILSIVFAGEYEDLKNMKKEIENKYSKDFNIHLLEVKSKGLYILEVLQKSGDKWHGLEKYLEINKVSKENIIVVGDDTNDILMIQKSGLGIAMKNAVEEVKSSADIITKYTNNENGAMREVFHQMGK